MWFRKKAPYIPSTIYQDWYREQIERIRHGEPIMWLLGTPCEILMRSAEIDRLNAKLKEKPAPH